MPRGQQHEREAGVKLERRGAANFVLLQSKLGAGVGRALVCGAMAGGGLGGRARSVCCCESPVQTRATGPASIWAGRAITSPSHAHDKAGAGSWGQLGADLWPALRRRRPLCGLKRRHVSTTARITRGVPRLRTCAAGEAGIRGGATGGAAFAAAHASGQQQHGRCRRRRRRQAGAARAHALRREGCWQGERQGVGLAEVLLCCGATWRRRLVATVPAA